MMATFFHIGLAAGDGFVPPLELHSEGSHQRPPQRGDIERTLNEAQQGPRRPHRPGDPPKLRNQGRKECKVKGFCMAGWIYDDL